MGQHAALNLSRSQQRINHSTSLRRGNEERRISDHMNLFLIYRQRETLAQKRYYRQKWSSLSRKSVSTLVVLGDLRYEQSNSWIIIVINSFLMRAPASSVWSPFPFIPSFLSDGGSNPGFLRSKMVFLHRAHTRRLFACLFVIVLIAATEHVTLKLKLKLFTSDSNWLISVAPWVAPGPRRSAPLLPVPGAVQMTTQAPKSLNHADIIAARPHSWALHPPILEPPSRRGEAATFDPAPDLICRGGIGLRDIWSQ